MGQSSQFFKLCWRESAHSVRRAAAPTPALTPYRMFRLTREKSSCYRVASGLPLHEVRRRDEIYQGANHYERGSWAPEGIVIFCLFRVPATNLRQAGRMPFRGALGRQGPPGFWQKNKKINQKVFFKAVNEKNNSFFFSPGGSAGSASIIHMLGTP